MCQPLLAKGIGRSEYGDLGHQVDVIGDHLVVPVGADMHAAVRNPEYLGQRLCVAHAHPHAAGKGRYSKHGSLLRKRKDRTAQKQGGDEEGLFHEVLRIGFA